MIKPIKAIALISLTFAGCLSNAAEYWVSKTGNNSNNCTSQALSCQSIQKGLNALVAGDILNIDEGTYIEDSTSSAFTSKCGLLDANYGSLCIKSSGTLDKPIVVRALPGKEGKVIIDSEGKRAGLIISKYDYIHIKNLTFINNWTGGIANPGGPAGVPTDDILSIGCLIEGNSIINTSGAIGINNSAIYMWSTKDWVVRNNIIQHVDGATNGTGSNGMQTYGTLNATIENNTIIDVDQGINWKDHYVVDTNTKKVFQESIIRNNRIVAASAGIRISIRGDGSNPAGHNQIVGNIFELPSSTSTGVAAYIAGASAISGDFEIKNNLFLSKNTGNKAIVLDSMSSVKIVGNVFAGITTPISLRLQSADRPAKLVESNYNVFDLKLLIENDKYSGDEENYSSLTSWQAAKPSADPTIVSLQFDTPDTYSVQRDLSGLLNTQDYKSLIKPVNGPNGTTYQPGPFQTPEQVIGASAALKAKPLPPKPL